MSTKPRLCACMGPQGNDPVCPCKMLSRGLKPHDSWTPEKVEEFKEVLSKLYNWKKDKND